MNTIHTIFIFVNTVLALFCMALAVINFSSGHPGAAWFAVFACGLNVLAVILNTAAVSN